MNKIAERLYKVFLFVDFHQNFIYSAKNYFYLNKDYFCLDEDFLGARSFFRCGVQRFFCSDNFTNMFLIWLKKIFICANIFLLVLIFFVCFFWGGRAKLLKIFMIFVLFWNIYEWSGALMQFHKDFFCINPVFIVSS